MDGNEEGLEQVTHTTWNDNYCKDEMLPAAATWRCDGQHQPLSGKHHVYTGVHARAVDSAVDVESKGETRLLGAILLNPHKIKNEDLGK
jgi:hypothetical protein